MTIEIDFKKSKLELCGPNQALQVPPPPHSTPIPLPPWPSSGKGFGESDSPFTSKGFGVNFNLVDGLAIVIHCKDELHFFSIVGLGAVKHSQASPQKLGPS